MKKKNEIVFTGIVFIAMAYGISRFSYGLLLPYFAKDLELTNQVSGIISAVSYLTYCLGLVSMFTLFRNYQPRAILMISGALSLYGLYNMMVAEHFPLFGSGVIILGYSAGLATAPFGQIIKEKVTYGYQDRSNSWINTGIGLGLILVGIIVWVVGDRWRIGYAVFLIVSLIIMWFSYKKLPEVDMSHLNYKTDLKNIFYGKKFIISTILLGIGTSAYWTYFQSYIFQTQYIQFTNLFWIMLGAGGMLGGFAGHMNERLGMTKIHILTAILLGVSNITLVLSEHFLLMMLSVTLFGLVYVFAMGVYAFWCARLYVEYPAMGIIVTFVSLAAGQFIGTFLSGFLLESYGYQTLFYIYGAFSLMTILFKPMAEELADI
ncbi:MFS transporter [Macrococcus carouselicus]|uniref:MFS transporter n=1 Tax=Macrococcus carouselicus TaxID=69969 RepID=A0A9Q8CLW6_9STAP|nr:MFS transporter [Macrococcus carouselicus]TDM02495.1 MFS transporter [Macrococcus carouselicus]